jgi:hypothetical protein
LGAALLLGVLGLVEAWHEARIPIAAGSLTAAIPGLFAGGVPAELALRPLPGALETATILVPLFAAWVVAGWLWLAVRNPVRLRLVHLRGDHMVVAADGDMARLALEGELAAGRPVVAWHGDPAPGWLREAARHGAALTTRISKAGLDRARAVLLAGADDRTNIAEAETVIAAAEEVRAAGDPLDVIVRVDDLELRIADEAARESRPLAPATRLRHASLPDLAARSLFVFSPLDRFVHDGGTSRDVLAIGFTPAIERTLARLLVGDHPRNGGKARITIATADPVATEAAFRARNGRADALAPIRFAALGFGQPAMETLALADPCIACLVDCGDDQATLAWGLAIDARFAAAGRPCPPVHLRLDHMPPPLPPMLHPFGSLDFYADPGRLLQEGQDELARAVHEFYLEGRLSEGERIGTRASMREWEDLPERFRDDNRVVADCYRLKLRDIGARLVRGNGPPLRFTPGELEELARAEHDRWMIAKLATGWTFGETRDDARKLHPDIVPYDSLSERIKDLDREQIRIMTRLLGSSGQRAVRVLTVALLPGEHQWPRLEPLLADLVTHYPDRLPLLSVVAADAPSCAALERLAPGGWLSLIACDGHVSDGPAAALLAAADTVVALPAGTPPAQALLAGADLALACGPASGEIPCPSIRLAADGAVAEAPWSR